MNAPRFVIAIVVGIFLGAWSGRGVADEGAAQPAGRLKEEILKRFDTDGDGKLNAEERAAAKAAHDERKAAGGEEAAKPLAKNGGKDPSKKKPLNQFDTNGDGKLDANEKAAARQAKKDRDSKRNGGQGDVNQGGFNPGNGINGLNGFTPQNNGGGQPGDGRQKLMEKFDMNRDGVLNAQEMQRAKMFMQQLRGAGQGVPNLPNGVPNGVGAPNVQFPQKPSR